MDHGYVHAPVLLEEVIEALKIRSNGVYADGTFGRGGHSRAILERLDENGRLLAMDKDPEAAVVAEELDEQDKRFIFKRGSFSMLDRLIESQGLKGKVDGILLDLGVSSPQLDDPQRGFSFQKQGPLDMRMDPDSGISAAEWLANVDEDDLLEVLRDFGEERHARRIARNIINARETSPLTTTSQLAELVSECVPQREPGKHPATRTFQAIRIYINSELQQLEETLPKAMQCLGQGGRLVVISFHSLEDRMVKRFMRRESKGDDYPVDLPVTADQLTPNLRVVGKAIHASDEETRVNPRARSAVMRVAERV